jgi:DNA invertase Pin-like site-specific DNA recombinase
MSVFGGMSKGERNRIKLRVRTAMAAQTLLEGRYLGGRPPYGYTLQDLGPYSNPAKAADGKHLRGLTPDPRTAPIVRQIFHEFLTGSGLYAIAEALTSNHGPPVSRVPDLTGQNTGAYRVVINEHRSVRGGRCGARRSAAAPGGRA